MCMFEYYDNLPEFERERVYKTRRRRQCAECQGWVPPGGYYAQISGKWDGEFKTFDVCRACQARAHYLSKECGGYVFDNILEDYESHFETVEESSLKLWNELVPQLDAA